MNGLNLMKTIFNTFKTSASFVPLRLCVSLLILPLTFALLSCDDQPFKAGLGAVVDTRPPSVALIEPTVGNTIFGRRTFTGYAEDDYKIERVEIRVTNYPNTGYLKGWTNVNLKKSVQNKGDWSINIDTTRFEDGDLKLMVRAFDSVREEPFTTDEYVFKVRNDLPKISLTSPSILEDDSQEDGIIRPGNSNLNFKVWDTLPTSIDYPRQLEPRAQITGKILYSEGIYTAPYNPATPNRYPPQIRMWRVSENPNPNPADGIPEFVPSGVDGGVGWPTEAQVPWVDFLYGDPKFTLKTNGVIGSGNYGFSMTVPETAGFYGFEIRAQSEDGRTKFRYPRDFWPEIEAKGDDWDNPPNDNTYNVIIENRYVLVYVRTTEDPAKTNFWDSEDILGEKNSTNWVNNDYTDLGLDPDKPHRYVNTARVDKNGDFTVRAWAKHSQSITDALLFWTSAGGEQGVFIWDNAYAPSNFTIPSEPTGFSDWGFTDPHDSTMRNYVFTYNHATKSPGKIWKYDPDKGSVRDTKEALMGVDPAALANLDGWEQVTTGLKEDTYVLAVYAKSTTGANEWSLERQVLLDWTPPTIEIITAIRGASSYIRTPDAPIPVLEAIVNGVIQPTLRRITDSGPSVSGMRVASETNTYFTERNEDTGAFDGPLGYEKFYVLIKNAEKVDFEKAIAYNGPNYWPSDFPASPSGDLEIPEEGGSKIKASRHGPVYPIGSADGFRFKTSAIYENGEAAGGVAEATLATGDYWLYVFARDKAFNVRQMDPVKIIVDPPTDLPTITVYGLNPTDYEDENGVKGVTTPPNYSKDGSPGGLGYLGGQNRVGANTNLRLQLRDDDGIDLGVSGGRPSSIKITMSGVTQNAAGDVTARSGPVPGDGDYVRTIDDAVIKRTGAFTPPSAVYKDGTIPQSALVDALYGEGIAYNYLFDKGKGTTLPDGIYHIEIAVGDDEDLKLKQPDERPGENGVMDVKKADKELWVFVDTTNPEITVKNAWEEAKWILPSSQIADLTKEQLWLGTGLNTSYGSESGIILEGTMSDRNGPVKVVDFYVTNGAGKTPDITIGTQTFSWGDLVKADPDEVNLPANRVWDHASPYAEDYKAKFEAPVHIDDRVSGDFIVTLVVEDRFSRRSLPFKQQFKRDQSPPTVSLRSPIPVFTRQYTELAGSMGNINYTRLANGVVSFEYSATDDLAVAEVRYWLIKSNTTGTSPNEITTSAFPSNKEAAWDYLFETTTPAIALGSSSTTGSIGKYGRFGNFSGTVYIATAGTTANPSYRLDDNAEYSLYILAKDTAGNISALPAKPLQTIYVRQEEDKPWFVSNPLNGAATKNSLRANIMVHDDDTFFANASKNSFRTETAWIRASSNASIPVNSTDIDNTHLSTYGYSAAYQIPNNRITAIGKNITLDVDFTLVLPIPETGKTWDNFTGRIHYVIEVTDSWVDKFVNESGTAASGPTAPSGINTASRRMHYSFEMDSAPPKVVITALTQDTFGKTGANFTVTGAISDAHLKMTDGSYILGIRLDNDDLFITTPNSTSQLKPFKLADATASPPYDYVTSTENNRDANGATVTGDTRVNFSIPWDKFVAAIGYTNTSVLDGRHTLVFSTEDQSAQKGNASLIFYKDTTPPSFDFTRGFNDNKTAMPPINGTAWWTKMNTAFNTWSEADRTSYRNQRANMPVISYEPLATGVAYTDETLPPITGTFTDALSNIARTSGTFKIKWDNPATATERTIPSALPGPGITTQLGDDGKTVTWKVYPTQNGTLTDAGTSSNPILTDGVHSIQLTVADAVDNVMVSGTIAAPVYTATYGFRVVSSTPVSELTQVNGLPARVSNNPNPAIKTVYGDVPGNNFNTRTFTTTANGTDNNIQSGTRYFTFAGHGLAVGDTVVVGGTSRYVLYANGNNFKLSNNYTMASPGTNVWNPAAGNISVIANVVFAITGVGTSPNLSDMRVRIRYTDTNLGRYFERSVQTANTTAIPGDTSVANPLTWELDSSGDKLTWTLPIPRSYIMYAGNVAPNSTTERMRAGNYEVMVIAVDSAGKTSEETAINTWQFIVDRDAPTFSFNLPVVKNAQGEPTDKTVSNTARGPAYWLDYKTLRNVLGDSPAITGRVSDANDLADVQLQLARWNYASGTGVWQIYNFTGNSWVATSTANLNAATSWTTLSLPSLPTSEYTVNWAFPAALDADPITAGVQPADGYYSVRLRARDSSSPTFGGTTAWGTDFAGATTDNGNPAASHYVYFFIDTKAPVLTAPANNEPFSSRYLPNHQVTFSVNATDPNYFENMVVSVERINTTGGTLPGNVTLTGIRSGASNTWTANAIMAFTPREVIPGSGSRPATGNATTGLPDGSYRIVFTATDLAGKVFRDTRTITLDNRAPTGAITEPRFRGEFTYNTTTYRFGSDIKTGGEPFAITGTADDLGENGSATGPKEIWYRIGYGTKDALPVLTEDALNTNSPDPAIKAAAINARSAQIAAWIIGSGDGLPTTLTYDRGSASNDVFEIAAKKTPGSLWFKYAQTGDAPALYDMPTHFRYSETVANIPANPDPYTWSMIAGMTGTASVAENYAVGGVSFRGRPFSDGANTTNNVTQYLARVIPTANLPADLRYGVYSLPLVIRVVDSAGNVFYDLRDIWLYPNGDNPRSNFLNPADPSTGKGAPRGGQFNIDGVAIDNVSIRNVIYRVKVGAGDDAAGTNPPDTSGGTSNIVTTIPGRAWNTQWNAQEYNAMNAIWNGKTVTEANGTGTLSKTGWFVANLDTATFDPTMPWNFILNSAGEITNLIATKGFKNPSTEANNNMIRVWVEVLVFDGSPDGSYNKMSLGEGTTANPINADKPRPYVREFYLTNAAPSVTTPQISIQGTPATFSDYTSPLAENNVRSGNFAVRATVSSTTKDISSIDVRLRGDPVNSDWRNVPATGALPVGVTRTWDTGQTNRVATLTYTFNSTATSSTTQQVVRNGAWAKSSGTMTVDIRVRDSSAAEATYTFEVGVDNFYPLADTSKNITPTKVAGTNVNFLGRAFDYQTNASPPAVPIPVHRKITAVHAWFSPYGSTTQYINMETGVPGNAAAAGAGTATAGVWTSPAATVTWTGANNNDVNTIISSGTPAQASRNIPTAANYVKTITEISGSGTTWSPSKIGVYEDVYWSFTQDTTKLPDGWITMHYVVVDQAGNRSYYNQSMIVMNNYPQITKVTLYTNNTGEGAVFTTHGGDVAESEYVIPEPGRDAKYTVGEYTYSSGYLKSEFISKNNVIGFGVDTIKGTAPLKYQARYVERYLVPLSRDNMVAMATRTGNLTYLPNSVYVNAQGILVNAAGASYTAATLPTESAIAVTGFVNLFTIAAANSNPTGNAVGNGSLGAAAWKLLGSPSTNPVDGSHFVFQAVNGGGGENDVTRMGGATGFNNVYVYAYREILSKTEVTRASPNHNTIAPGDLNFDGADYFSPTDNAKINEARGNNPLNATQANSTGTAYFLIKVWDTVNAGSAPTGTTPGLPEKDMLYDAIVIGMKVDVGDDKNPFARLYELNPYAEMDVMGGNSNATFRQQTLDAAAAPYTDGEIGENIKRGGLYNIGTESAPIKSGYVDPRTGSAVLNQYVNRPNDPLDPYKGSRQERPNGFVTGDAISTGDSTDKVSGSVILRGLAWDDQMVKTISINIGGTSKTILTLWYVYPDDHATPALRGTKFTTNTPTAAQITTNGLVRRMMPETGVQAWAYESIHWQTGHTVEWAYLWNTETEPSGRARGGPRTGVNVAVEAIDLNGNNKAGLPSATVTTDTPTANPPNFRNTINVDIVPYVVGFKRADRFATKRSRQGWYSFFQGEGVGVGDDYIKDNGIAVLGYNLGDSGRTAVSLNATTNATGGSPAPMDYKASTNVPNDSHRFAIPATQASSRINVSYTPSGGGTATDAYNFTSSHANKSWNKEKSDFISGSDLWTNKLYAHIWRTTETNTAPVTYFGNNSGSGGSWDMESPSMALEYGTTSGTSGETTGNGSTPGRLHGVWAHRSTFKTFYAANDTGAAIRLQEAQDPQAYTDMAYYPSENNANNLTAVYVYQWDALPNLLVRTHMKYLADGTNALGLNPGGTIVPFLIMRENRDDKTDTRRWQNVRTSTPAANVNSGSDADYQPHGNQNRDNQNEAASRGRSGRVYTSGYDAVSNNVFFVERIGSINYPSPGEGGQTNSRLPLFIDGGTAASGVNNMSVTGLTGYTATTTSSRAGNWNAIDYVTNGGTNNTTTVPVIAYYDEANDTLRLAYGSVNGTGTDGANGTGARWTRRNVLPSNHKLFRGSGKYVSMKVDQSNTIHLAFYNSNYSAMVYASGTRTGAFTAYIVDNVVTGGTWTDISVEGGTANAAGNPWIVYGDSGRSGNYDGVRIAYKGPTTGTGAFTRAFTDTVTGATLTGWEALTMPADYTIADDRLNIEAWPPTNRSGRTLTLGTASPNGAWNVAVGYAGTGGTTKQFRIGYFIKPSTALQSGL
jgi:hypothetical protein